MLCINCNKNIYAAAAAAVLNTIQKETIKNKGKKKVPWVCPEFHTPHNAKDQATLMRWRAVEIVCINKVPFKKNCVIEFAIIIGSPTKVAVVNNRHTLPARDNPVEIMDNSPEFPLFMFKTICGTRPPNARIAIDDACRALSVASLHKIEENMYTVNIVYTIEAAILTFVGMSLL